MAKSSTSFAKGNKLGGRPPVTEVERRANEMRQQCQPEVIEFFLGVVRDEGAEMRDRLAAGKALLMEPPAQLRVSGADGEALNPFASLTVAELQALARAKP